MLRSVAFCRPQPARRTLPRSAPLPGAVPAALAAPAAGACFRKRRAAVCRGPEPGIRGHHGQAPRQPLPGRPALARLAQNQGGTLGRVSDRRLHARPRPARGRSEPLGALLLGYWEGKSLRYAGHVGSGLDDEVIGALLKRAAKLERRTSPFADPPPLHRPTRWLKPELVAEVSFSEWTPGGALRAPVLVRLREDIAPRSVAKRVADAAPRAEPLVANTRGAGAP